MTLPRSLSAATKTMLRNIQAKEQPWDTQDFVDAAEASGINRKTSYNFKYVGLKLGWFTSNPKEGDRVRMTALGEKVVKELDNIPTFGSLTKKNDRQKSPPTPEPIVVNISKTANNAADLVTAVIEENAQLRKLLTDIHQTLGRALDL